MARISQVWAQSVSDYVAVQLFNFTPDQPGYDAAEAYLVGKGGGVLYVGAGLEGLTIAPPANVVVVRMRAGSAPGMEMWGNLILPAGFSIRATDSAGTRRTVLTPILDAINGDTVRLAYMNAVKGLLLSDHNGVEKARLTASRFSLGAGVDFAPNGLPGTVGQVLTSQGPGVPPTYTTPAAAVTKYQFYPAPIFAKNGIETVDVGGTVDGSWNGLSTFIAGGIGRNHQTQIVIPGDFNALTRWELWWTSGGTSVVGVDWRFGLGKLTNGTDSTVAMTLTNQTVAPTGVADQTIVTALSAPALALVAGDVCKMLIRRPGTDVNPDPARLIGARLVYT